MIDTTPTWDLPGADLRVGTLYGIGRNYAAHAREMGGCGARLNPMVFLKPASAYVPTGSAITLPGWSHEIHHEVELVVVIGHGEIAGLGVGLDLTARDVQAAAKEHGTPWALAKGWRESAPVSPIIPLDACGKGPWTIALSIDGEERQKSSLHVTWSAASINWSSISTAYSVYCPAMPSSPERRKASVRCFASNAPLLRSTTSHSWR